MRKRIAWWRHAVVGGVITAVAALILLGILGERNYPERYDAKQVTVQPSGRDGLTIREVVDQDFGSNERHGYERTIPTDFGVPTDVSASSPDAPADVSTSNRRNNTRIRVGDPDTTVSGQHRYVLTYTLPDAHLDEGELALDIIWSRETLETGRFDVVVAGFDLDDPRCNVGATDASGGCSLERDGDVYRASISPHEPGEGITIGGQITERHDTVGDVPLPPPIDRRDDRRVLAAASMALVGVLTAALIYLLCLQKGRNDVFVGGAADAAFGSMPPPGNGERAAATATAAIRHVSDAKLASMATIEFAPPDGLDPWHGAVLLRECIDEDTVSAWFSGLIARQVLDMEPNGDVSITIRRGPKIDECTPQEAALLQMAFGERDSLRLGDFDGRFALAWGNTQSFQAKEVASSKWWKRGTPEPSTSSGRSIWAIVFAVLGVFIVVSVIGEMSGLTSHPVSAVVFGAVVVAIAATIMYRELLPARSATGSALALRTESFRRFLSTSEGRHVEWAWERGVIREYSAWAVALGAADAWNDALVASNVPETDIAVATLPLQVYWMSGLVHSTLTAPTYAGSAADWGSSGGGFSGGGLSGGGFAGGGFSGGDVGGGGGGGGSGSW